MSSLTEVTKFTFKCTDCGARNKTEHPPEDNVLHCTRCGFPTVQVCIEASRKIGKTTTTWKPGA